jgi:uncharacterized membrane protein
MPAMGGSKFAVEPSGETQRYRRRTDAARLFAAASVLAVCLLWASGPVAGQGRSLDIEDFHADIAIRPDAALDVTEHLQIRFQGSWNGIYREIPVRYAGAGLLRFTDVQVTDGNGNTLRHQLQHPGGRLRVKVWVPDAHDVTRTVVLHYRVQGALRFFPDHDELYWNVTGSEWQYPIEHASATVLLPSGADSVRTNALTGRTGSRDRDADVAVRSGLVDYTTRTALPPGSGLTIVAGWNPGLVQRPTQLEGAASALAMGWPLLIPLITFLAMFLVWRRIGVDPPEGPVVVRYQPPDGLSPAEVGYVDHDGAAARQVTATLVDLAVHGHIRIEEEERGSLLGLGAGTDYVFERLTEPTAWLELHAFERTLLDGLFDHGTESRVSMRELKGKFYKPAGQARSQIGKQVLADRFYGHSPDRVRGFFASLGAVVGVALFALGAAAAAGTDGVLAVPTPAIWIVAAIGTALSFILWGWLMPARTSRGAAAHAEVEGFREFLSRVDADRYERTMLKPEMFDRFLPFAMALGVEDRWAKRFEGMTVPPPQWYVGTSYGSFSPGSFVGAMSGMSHATSGAMAAPGGSGLGGGGFAGGGAGGGGGGGF